MKVSVIVPNFNHAQYLQQRIDSILAQTFQDFELIIIDDKSTDNSAQVLEQYAAMPQVRHLIFNKKNSGGPFGSWQTGFDLAQGEYIWIAESDDWADPLFLEQTVASLEANEQAGIAYTDSYIVDSTGKREGNWKDFKNTKFKNTKWNNNYHQHGVKELLENMMVFMTINNMSACLIRKSALPKMTEVLKLRGAGDWLFCALILMEHDIVYLANALNYYRTHEENATKGNAKSGLLLIEDLKVYEILLDTLKQKNINTTEVEFKMLDRYLFKYASSKNIQKAVKKTVWRQMRMISFSFYTRFCWMLLKYRIKQVFR